MDAPFRKDVDPSEISVAFGARAIPKLIDILNNREIDTDGLLRAFKELNGMLSNQECKVSIVAAGGHAAALPHLSSKNVAVAKAAAVALSYFSAIPQGRDVMLHEHGIGVISSGFDLFTDAFSFADAVIDSLLQCSDASTRVYLAKTLETFSLCVLLVLV